jgi:hypothetical protein
MEYGNDYDDEGRLLDPISHELIVSDKAVLIRKMMYNIEKLVEWFLRQNPQAPITDLYQQKLTIPELVLVFSKAGEYLGHDDLIQLRQRLIDVQEYGFRAVYMMEEIEPNKTTILPYVYTDVDSARFAIDSRVDELRRLGVGHVVSRVNVFEIIITNNYTLDLVLPSRDMFDVDV